MRVAIAGHFNPLHIGHLELIRGAWKLGDELIVIVCNDEQAKLKRPKIFMPEQERADIVAAIKNVDRVVISIDKTADIKETLRLVRPDIYANGCDENHPDVLEEIAVCNELGIKAVFNVGGQKIRNSSEYLNEYAN